MTNNKEKERQTRSATVKKLWQRPEYRAKQRAAKLGEKNPMFGRADAISRFSGKKHSSKTKIKISATMKGNQHLLGYHHTIETRANMSIRRRGKNHPLYGKQHKLETRRKISIAIKTLWADPEYAKKVFRNVSPNKAELKLQDILDRHFPSKWKFVGNRGVRLGELYPDFVNVNGKKEVIELFGEHWHPLFDIAQKKERYRQYGFRVAIIWDDELEDEERLVKTLPGKFRSGGNIVLTMSS